MVAARDGFGDILRYPNGSGQGGSGRCRRGCKSLGSSVDGLPDLRTGSEGLGECENIGYVRIRVPSLVHGVARQGRKLGNKRNLVVTVGRLSSSGSRWDSCRACSARRIRTRGSVTRGSSARAGSRRCCSIGL